MVHTGAEGAALAIVVARTGGLATIGDPLADLGYLCATWSEPGEPPIAFELTPVTRFPGFPTRAELIARYEERTGAEVGDANWYQALALWKAAVFMEGNYRRAREGLSDDPFALAFEAGVEELVGRAAALTV